jgi:hypothetical protein
MFKKLFNPNYGHVENMLYQILFALIMGCDVVHHLHSTSSSRSYADEGWRKHKINSDVHIYAKVI